MTADIDRAVTTRRAFSIVPMSVNDTTATMTGAITIVATMCVVTVTAMIMFDQRGNRKEILPETAGNGSIKAVGEGTSEPS